MPHRVTRFVVDASVGVEYLLRIPLGLTLADTLNDASLLAPELLDAEVLSVLRRAVLNGNLDVDRAGMAVDDLTSWPEPAAIVLWGKRYPVSRHVDAWRMFLDAIYERHRDNFSPVLGIRGTKYPHVARDPQALHQEGRTYHHEPMSSGYFFAIPSSVDGFEKRPARFLACLGDSASDFKILYDQDPAE